MFWFIVAVVIIAIIAYSKRDKIKQSIKASKLQDDKEFIDKVNEARRMKEIAEGFSEHVFLSMGPVYRDGADVYYKTGIVFFNLTDCLYSKYLIDMCRTCSCEEIEKFLDEYKAFLIGQTGVGKQEFDKYFSISKIVYEYTEINDGMVNMSIPYNCPCGLIGQDKELFIKAVNQQ